MVDVTGNQHNT